MEIEKGNDGEKKNDNQEKTMKITTYKKLVTMAKKIYGWMLMGILGLALVALCAPCVFVFSVGHDGELTIWNFVGLAWCLILYGIFKKFS